MDKLEDLFKNAVQGKPYRCEIDEIFQPKEKQTKFNIHMDITMDREMYLDEAEIGIFNALRNAWMTSHRGGIS